MAAYVMRRNSAVNKAFPGMRRADAMAGLRFQQVESAQLKGFMRPVKVLALLADDDERSEAS